MKNIHHRPLVFIASLLACLQVGASTTTLLSSKLLPTSSTSSMTVVSPIAAIQSSGVYQRHALMLTPVKGAMKLGEAYTSDEPARVKPGQVYSPTTNSSAPSSNVVSTVIRPSYGFTISASCTAHIVTITVSGASPTCNSLNSGNTPCYAHVSDTHSNSVDSTLSDGSNGLSGGSFFGTTTIKVGYADTSSGDPLDPRTQVFSTTVSC